MDVAGVLQEAGDADSRARTRSQVQVDYHSSILGLSHPLFLCHSDSRISGLCLVWDIFRSVSPMFE